MMTFRAGCGPLVHVNATSQNSACVFVQGRQFTANCYTGMADVATVVSQALGIKLYGVTCVFVQGLQFTANCYTGMADVATVVSQALGIKFYGVTAYHGQRFSFRLELHNQ